ncbi:MAG: hypothetical protein FJX02_03705 [Alphaproteobacteria bacterium]|nr:hypothetical protein [Alphaproteobacteria bacterium]
MSALSFRRYAPIPRLENTRLAEWWPAALLGLVAVVAGTPQGHAQSRDGVQVAEAQRVAQGMANNDSGWRDGLRSYLGDAGGDRRAMVDRSRGVFEAFRGECDRGGPGCRRDTVREAIQVAAGRTCAANVVPVAVSANFTPPRGALAFDFQPVGNKPAQGFRAVVPGDPRLVGGARAVAEIVKDDLSDDSLRDVRRFRTPVPKNGEYRVIITGEVGHSGNGAAFGGQVTINGRTVDVQAGEFAGVAAVLGDGSDALRRVRASSSRHAPMLVFDVSIGGKDLDLQFGGGATISGIVLEPAGGRSVLDMPPQVANNGVTRVEQCTSAESQVQQAADGALQAPAKSPTRLLSGLPKPPEAGALSPN